MEKMKKFIPVLNSLKNRVKSGTAVGITSAGIGDDSISVIRGKFNPEGEFSCDVFTSEGNELKASHSSKTGWSFTEKP